MAERVSISANILPPRFMPVSHLNGVAMMFRNAMSSSRRVANTSGTVCMTRTIALQIASLCGCIRACRFWLRAMTVRNASDLICAIRKSLYRGNCPAGTSAKEGPPMDATCQTV